MYEIKRIICIKMDLALNSQQSLISHETQITNQSNNQPTTSFACSTILLKLILSVRHRTIYFLSWCSEMLSKLIDWFWLTVQVRVFLGVMPMKSCIPSLRAPEFKPHQFPAIHNILLFARRGLLLYERHLLCILSSADKTLLYKLFHYFMTMLIYLFSSWPVARNQRRQRNQVVLSEVKIS